MFNLHPILQADTAPITRLVLSHVLLIRDKTYPWVILVPERDGLRDLDDLSDLDHTQVMTEINIVSKALKDVFAPYKLNVAALGNVVEQLHIHVIARFQDDPAWPAPVWGKHPAHDYQHDERDDVIRKIAQAIEDVQQNPSNT